MNRVKSNTSDQPRIPKPSETKDVKGYIAKANRRQQLSTMKINFPMGYLKKSLRIMISRKRWVKKTKKEMYRKASIIPSVWTVPFR